MAPESELLAIFPLSNVVLFPQVRVPLHLFEPRYRQLAEQVLAGSRRIGMVVVRPEHVHEMAGDPPVFEVGCAGLVCQDELLEDGRYNIVLQGSERFRIVDEPPRPGEQLYRVARVEPLEEHYPLDERPRVGALRSRIVEHVTDLIRLTEPGRASELPEGFLRELEDAAFVNALCNALAFPPAEKQGLLEAASVPERFARLESLLSFRIASLRSSGAAGSGLVH